MKSLKIILIVKIGILSCLGQGFLNLNFESGSIPSGTSPGAAISVNTAIPGWSVYSVSQTFGTNQGTQILYDTIDLGGGGIFIYDTNNPGLQPIQGNFSVFLHGSTAGGPYGFSIGQSGQISATAQSLTFLGSVDTVSFNGQVLATVFLGVSQNPNYGVYGADISSFAGQTGQLLFSAIPSSGAYIDNIQFSSAPIPEPSAFALAALGGSLLGWRRKLRIR